MARQGINTGVSPNDGSGDTLLAGAIKINSNFLEIYDAIGTGTSLPISIKLSGNSVIISAVGIGSTTLILS